VPIEYSQKEFPVFVDPQVLKLPLTVTYESLAQLSLPRTSSSINYGQYAIGDATSKFTVQHSYAKRVRRVVRLDSRQTSPDPLTPAVNVEQSMSAYFVVDVPRTGFTVSQQMLNASYVAGWLLDGPVLSDNLLRMLGGES
jgi:hypothetical protein